MGPVLGAGGLPQNGGSVELQNRERTQVHHPPGQVRNEYAANLLTPCTSPVDTGPFKGDAGQNAPPGGN